MEKHMDLASLFCMIGRHGPAVAVAVIAMVSVVAGFIIYRTVKGKRRKAEAGPGAGDVSGGSGSSSSQGATRDAVQPEKEPSPEREARSRVESTGTVTEDKTTEINIMEATMDNNEWITDGTDQVLPWIKPSSPQINPVSIEKSQASSSVNAACTYADVPPVNECEEDNTVPLSDEATETSKRVLAVQPMPQNVSVTFQIHYLTHSPYQKVAITGNHFDLGNWKDFVPLEKVKDGFWATVVNLPAESHVEWKFVIVERGEVCRWEECGNRFLDTGNRETLLVHKCWGFL
uniref:Starch-binding domain-containing protein 1 n=1 Tax=Xiphophorus couchianus TaxID=32473 RepID=A0A3B5LMS5_9TELE